MGFVQRLKKDKLLQRRLFFILLAHVIIALAVNLMRIALFGNDPFSCMQLGFSKFFNASYGTCVIVFNLIAIIPIFIIDRSYIQIGTLINMFLFGLIVDVWYMVIALVYPDFGYITLLPRIICLILGVIICCFGASMYMVTNLGMGPYDAIGWIIEKLTKKKVPFKYARMALDGTATLVGFLFGSIVGIGTLIMALGTGPLIMFFTDNINKQLVYGG
ncbi:MAG: hypothetical protein J5809_09365 [Selenomonadaceae bacterium]|nr:hypothetical protein [Selenomonadaceae bacterium]